MAHDLTTEAVRLAMGMQQLRAENASRNIALANTPGARATRLDFGSSQGLLEQAAAQSTDAAQGLLAALDTTASRPAVSESQDASGTGIHLDGEVADMAGANLQYQALAESLSRHFGLMRLAISGEELNMSIESVMEATRAGLDYERMRMDAASRNIAAANMPVAPGTAATTAQVVGSVPDFASKIGSGAGFEVRDTPIGTRDVLDPGHPLADAQGMVHYPATDLVGEMTTLMTASRGYEANVRAFNLLRGMEMKAIEIGAK